MRASMRYVLRCMTHDIQKHIFQVSLADFDVLRLQSGFAHCRKILFDFERIVRRKLHNTARNAGFIP
jgi:hypothetical protein